MPPSEFKHRFFDRMDAKGILYVSDKLGDMDDFLEGLTIEDWKTLTPAEWTAFLTDNNVYDLVDFIHEMHEADRKVIEDMFRFMPAEMLSDFKEAEDLAEEFSKEEMETMWRGMKENKGKKSLFDFMLEDKEDFTFDNFDGPVDGLDEIAQENLILAQEEESSSKEKKPMSFSKILQADKRQAGRNLRRDDKEGHEMGKGKGKKGCHKGKGGHGVKGQHRNGAR